MFYGVQNYLNLDDLFFPVKPPMTNIFPMKNMTRTEPYLICMDFYV